LDKNTKWNQISRDKIERKKEKKQTRKRIKEGQLKEWWPKLDKKINEIKCLGTKLKQWTNEENHKRNMNQKKYLI